MGMPASGLMLGTDSYGPGCFVPLLTRPWIYALESKGELVSFYLG